MEAYEFQAAVNDGVINIPAEYRNKLYGKIKVILLSENPDNKRVKKAPIPYFGVETKGYVFDRDEANER